MSGVGIEWTMEDLAALQLRIDSMQHMDTRDLMDSIGAEVVTQTQRRITSEKTTPAGEAWPQWSDNYAKTRNAGQSLEVSEGHLVTSITHLVEMTGKDVDIGSNLVYAAMQNFGGAEIGKPQMLAHEYLGLSTENVRDVQQIASDWLDHRLSRMIH